MNDWNIRYQRLNFQHCKSLERGIQTLSIRFLNKKQQQQQQHHNNTTRTAATTPLTMTTTTTIHSISFLWLIINLGFHPINNYGSC